MRVIWKVRKYCTENEKLKAELWRDYGGVVGIGDAKD